MNAMELLNILNKVGINVDAERFTQESFEYRDPFYNFSEYMKENYPNFDFFISNGATKAVLVPYHEDYVLKIPFSGFEDWENQPYYEDEETGEWVYDDDYDAFVPFENVCDYCQLEVENYQNSIIEGISEAFAEISFIGIVNNLPIYAQKKVTTFWDARERTRHSEEERNSFKTSHTDYDLDKLPYDWCLDFIAAFGEEKFRDFIQFTIDNHINDLHGDNVAYRNGKPILSDFSGFWE